jgi:hypothetical protein
MKDSPALPKIEVLELGAEVDALGDTLLRELGAAVLVGRLLVPVTP